MMVCFVRLPFVVLVSVLLLAALGSGLAAGRVTGGTPVALVTAEGENEVLAVSLPGARVLRRVHLPDPQAIAADQHGDAVVVSPEGTVTLLDWRTLKVVATLHGFRSP